MSGFGAPQTGAKPSNFKATFGRLARLLLADRLLVWGLLVFGVLGTAFSVIGPRILGHATDLVFNGAIGGHLQAGVSKAEVVAGLRADGKDQLANLISSMDLVPGQGIQFHALALVLAGVAVLYLVSSLMQWFQGVMATTVVQHMVAKLRTQVEGQVHAVPLAYLDSQERGEILSRTTNDIDNIAQSIQQTLSQMISSILMVLGTLVMMFWISPLLSLIAILTLPVAAVLTAAITKRSQPQFVAQWQATGKLNGHVEEVYTGHEIVSVFGHRERARTEFDESNDALFGAAFRAQFISGVIQPIMMFVSNINFVLVAVVGGLRVASGHLSLGSVQAFIQYSRQFSHPLMQVASMINLLQSGLASAERVFALLDEPRESPDAPDAPAPDPVRGRIEFRGVQFSYPGSDRSTPLISGLDLVAEPGQTIAIVGPTGAGKTTLTNLLLRFYEVDAGEILLDGINIADMARGPLRDNFGVVLQDAWLFGGTIRDNIAYGAADASDEQITTAAEAALVDHFVRTMPAGYESHIDEEGGGVSAGQRQLLTIARAFLSDPAILILDEATSSVDTRTEKLVQQAMERLRIGRTSFVIAHRLSTIRDADRIVVMVEGDIVEQGTHAGLLAAGGHYANLYAAQFAAAGDGPGDMAAVAEG